MLVFKRDIQARRCHSEHSTPQNVILRSCVWLPYRPNTKAHDSEHKNVL